LIRAYRLYFISVKNQNKAKPVAWDKTEHSFPGRHLLVPYRQRLGDLLVEQKLITEAQLTTALIECQATGDRIGDVLVRLGAVTSDVLLRSLGKQYALRLFQERDLQASVEVSRKLLPTKLMRWFSKTGIAPVAVDVFAATATLGIIDPTNEVLIASALKRMPSYKIEFVLIDPSVIDV
jgi:bacteriophage N4 adsorption protein B